MGQTMMTINYDLAVQHDVQLNLAFGASDTLIYFPLIIFSIAGLIFKKLWS